MRCGKLFESAELESGMDMSWFWHGDDRTHLGNRQWRYVQTCYSDHTETALHDYQHMHDPALRVPQYKAQKRSVTKNICVAAKLPVVTGSSRHI